MPICVACVAVFSFFCLELKRSLRKLEKQRAGPLRVGQHQWTRPMPTRHIYFMPSQQRACASEFVQPLLRAADHR